MYTARPLSFGWHLPGICQILYNCLLYFAWVRSTGKVYFYFHIVLLKGCRVLYLPKYAVYIPANTARLGKYSTLANIDYSPLLHYHSLPLPLLSSRHTTCIIPRRRCAAISCIPLLPSLLFAAINNWFRRNFCVSRLFFQLATQDYSKLYYHSLRLPDYHCTSQMRLHNTPVQ